jgi:hypothetical protein
MRIQNNLEMRNPDPCIVNGSAIMDNARYIEVMDLHNIMHTVLVPAFPLPPPPPHHHHLSPVKVEKITMHLRNRAYLKSDLRIRTHLMQIRIQHIQIKNWIRIP